MKTTKQKHLTKDEELELGTIIQKHYKAREELNSGKRITAAKKAKLEIAVKEGERAVDTLVRANIGLVHDRVQIFKSRYPSGPEYEDLVQEGMAGLMTAVHKYDPDRGNKFSTVAYYWIAQAVARGANKTGRTVRLPENRINDFSKINKITNSPEVEDFTPVELDNFIMEQLGLSTTDLMNIRNAASTPASLNKVISSESGNTKELIDFIEDKDAVSSSEDQVMRDEMTQVLHESVNNLNNIKRDIIYATFPIGDQEMMTSEEVRSKWDLQPFTFKRLQAQAIMELKTSLTKKGFSFEDFA